MLTCNRLGLIQLLFPSLAKNPAGSHPLNRHPCGSPNALYKMHPVNPITTEI